MPAYLLVLSRFYSRREVVFRTALFASSATIAGMFGGLLGESFPCILCYASTFANDALLQPMVSFKSTSPSWKIDGGISFSSVHPLQQTQRRY
jgi:hypothetical protein